MPRTPQTVTLPLIDDDKTIEGVVERLRDMKRGGFVLADPRGSRVVTASALELIKKTGDFDDNTKIGDLRDRIILTWTEPQSIWDRVRGRVNVGGMSVPRALAVLPQEGYTILEMDRTNKLATVLANDPRQLEELQAPPAPKDTPA
jgi:hypothetical protein